MRIRGVLGAIAMLLALTSAACAATEETTPRGYVIAPSVPADAGASALASDGGV